MTDVGDVLRIVVRDVDDRGRGVTYAHDVEPGAPVSLGRTEPLAVGARDEGVSRVALTVVAGPTAWELQLANRNGAQAHGWAQAPVWLAGGTDTAIRWPRLGLRLFGHDPDAEHWVLLEADRYAPRAPATELSDGSDTVLTPRPRGLTANQLAALYATFPEHLAWPPVPRPSTRSLEAVAHRLGVTASAVRERLRPVQDRARELGLPEPAGVTDPDYVFHLATHGYLPDVPPPFEPE